jgi:hypothetical protein
MDRTEATYNCELHLNQEILLAEGIEGRLMILTACSALKKSPFNTIYLNV